MSQLREAEESEATTAKQLLYVLRTALTGTHLLRTGEVVTDLGLLCGDHGLADARELIAAKRAGERVVLSGEARTRWLARVQVALDALDRARDASPLPEEPDSRPLESWLVELRADGL